MTKTTTNKLFTSSLLSLLVAASACDLETQLADEGDADELGESSQELYNPTSPPAAVATNLCDDDTYAAAAWQTQSSEHFVANFLPGTDAERDIASILAKREAAYAQIRAALGITATPTITLYLSPNRVAAGAKGRSMGAAFPGADRIEAVYNGAPDSFENARHGNLLTRALEYHLDSANPKHVALLSAGLAEYLDQSSRNLHDAYAQQIYAGVETRTRLVSFESGDLTGKYVGRAGSLVKFLIDRYGMATFVEIFKASAVASAPGCSTKSATYGCINSTTALTALLDGVLTEKTGDSWATVTPLWKAEVEARMAVAKVVAGTADRNAITNLVNVMDQAINTGDAAIYRSTMEGFYCEWGGEAQRADIASRTVESYGSAQSSVTRIYVGTMGNFPTAKVLVRRVDERGYPAHLTFSAEKFPEGWRITYGPDWF